MPISFDEILQLFIKWEVKGPLSLRLLRGSCSVGITNKLMGGLQWRAIASLEIFLGAPLGGPKFLQILYNANDGFHRLF